MFCNALYILKSKFLKLDDTFIVTLYNFNDVFFLYNVIFYSILLNVIQIQDFFVLCSYYVFIIPVIATEELGLLRHWYVSNVLVSISSSLIVNERLTLWRCCHVLYDQQSLNRFEISCAKH